MATKWKIDQAHSAIQFKVKHLMISTVTGNFEKFDLKVETPGEDFSNAGKVLFTAEIDSISTKNTDRDAHLKSADFFNGTEFPQLKFEGTGYTVSGDEATLQGDLSIRGTTKAVTLKVELGGIVVDPYGQTKAGFTVEGRISRKEFGLTWNALTETGSVVVSDEVKIHAEIQLVKQAELVTA